MQQIHRRLATVSLTILVAALACTGCGLSSTPVVADETDDARLAALADDPLFTDGSVTGPQVPDTSANVSVQRGAITVEDLWPSDVTAEPGARGPAWPAATTMLAQLREAGWRPVAVSCELDRSSGLEGATVYATKEFDDFTAALEAEVRPPSSKLVGYVPFHAETDDPWSAHSEVPAGSSCLDGDGPPSGEGSVPDDLAIAPWY